MKVFFNKTPPAAHSKNITGQEDLKTVIFNRPSSCTCVKRVNSNLSKCAETISGHQHIFFLLGC